MASVLRGARLPQRASEKSWVCMRCAASITTAASGLRPSIQQGRYPLTEIYISKRHFNQSKKTLAKPKEETFSSRKTILLDSESRISGDIRQYLRKWQEDHANTLDPVRGPGTSNEGLDSSMPWVGSMLNDNREIHDAGTDALRVADEDISDFSQTADEGDGIHAFLEPGDLVAFPYADGGLSFAIYIQSVQKQHQFYTDRGKWRIGFDRSLDYVVKGFASPDLLQPLYPHIPDRTAMLGEALQSIIEGGIPRPLGAPLLRQMDQFSEKAKEFYRANSTRLDDMHALVAENDDCVEYTLEELAETVLAINKDELDAVSLFAVHKASRQFPFLIENDRSSIFANHYLVQPKRIANLIKTVHGWVHDHQTHILANLGQHKVAFNPNPLQSFIQKAQRLIRLSRKVRSPTVMSMVGPSGQRFTPEDGNGLVYKMVGTEPFNSDDQKIIEYLQLFCIPPRRMTSGALRTIGCHIMRATGMYDMMDVSSASAPLLLQELGVSTPWENMRLLDQSLALPGHSISARADAQWKEALDASKRLDASQLEDRMCDVRTDWGDLPVYCVDDVDAQEIDDGVSLEPVPGSDDTFWIRVHIANPSAFISHDTSIMKYAASRYQTVYAPERTYPMLPDGMTQKFFSLSSGRPTLTFSAKMNLSGDVLETDIRNGTIRNVIYITHDKLRTLFESDARRQARELTVGGKFIRHSTRKGIQESMSSDDEERFHILRKLILAFREYRKQNGAMEWPLSAENSVRVSAGKAPMKPYNMKVHTGRYVLGDPVIQVTMRDFDPHEVPDLSKRNLVAPLMNLACWVSGKWCAERNIPVVYDGTWYHPEYPKLTNKNMSEYGGGSWFDYAAPRGVSSTTPIHHTPLGLDAYVKSTSPLRRYVDLIAHYQIEAALRFEQKHGRQFDASQDASALPFSKEDVETYIARSRWKHSRIRAVDNASKQFWACMFLFRGFYFGECTLPETFPCLLHRPYSNTTLIGTEYGYGYAGVITSLGVRCHVAIPEKFPAVDVLSMVEAKITSVDFSRMLVTMEATQVIKHFERVGEWA
ncbi:hypothetical protein ASPZODRAFT_108705 [Penicilliopsis zonata CBS 506.65]|uniref:RNB domain-containing protein n=1 Tax=Penicilliopsis zonata CBS 506.65 TaxID=1073090 RepID=A0A1L9SXB8_9EURO|nr:hypothetical protein ASPZODRAFT_108705 [Penicilliopsis zonata CBS 506.65]OJJ51741.1 hypothetical protein ASPZODRAFT_108705 [Penicilliopsis zonata CBS 506.65]